MHAAGYVLIFTWDMHGPYMYVQTDKYRKDKGRAMEEDTCPPLVSVRMSHAAPGLV